MEDDHPREKNESILRHINAGILPPFLCVTENRNYAVSLLPGNLRGKRSLLYKSTCISCVLQLEQSGVYWQVFFIAWN
jgi:hypothetical protein